jgi:RNA polymerase sigma factor (sigma-70 family)
MNDDSIREDDRMRDDESARELKHFQNLLREVQHGSEEAAREMYETYVSYVLRCVRHRMWRRLRPRFDSQDFVQAVWASFFNERQNLPDFQTPEDLTAYLIAMARNKVVMQGRRGQTDVCNLMRETPLDEPGEGANAHPTSRDPTPSAIAVYHEQFDRLVMRQPAEVRRVAALRTEGNTYHEIAERLDIAERTARRSIQKLKDEALPRNPPRSE